MLIPEGNRPRANSQTDLEFGSMIARIHAYKPRSERASRHAAYGQVSNLVNSLLPGDAAAEGLHTHPIEVNDNHADRLVFICRDRVPGHGNLLRVIVNEVAHELLDDSEHLRVRDFVLSPTQKAMTFQQSSIVRKRGEPYWPKPEIRGPVLYKLHDSLVVASGSEYHVCLPKSSGYPRAHSALLEQRVLLESLVGDLLVLGGVTHEPGHPSPAGIMS